MAWRQYVPKLVTVLREGYGFAQFRRDSIAGLTVAIVALPLAMALGIASGATPDKGLLTAGIAVIIFTSQIKDLFGLTMPEVPAAVAEKLGAFWSVRDTIRAPAVALSALSLAIIVAMRRFAPRLPAFLVAVVAASAIALV